MAQKKDLETYKKWYCDFIEDKLARDLISYDENGTFDDIRYNKVAKIDNILKNIDIDTLVDYVTRHYGYALLDNFDGYELLDAVDNWDIVNYATSHLYAPDMRKIVREYFDQGWLFEDGIENQSISDMLMLIGSNFTRGHLTKERLKEILCDYVDNQMPNLSSDGNN